MPQAAQPPDHPAEDVPERQVGRRTYSRLRVFLPARLISVFGTQQVQIHNLSRSGVKLLWTDPVRVGGDVVMAWAHHELFGKVVWSQPQYGGVLLDEPLTEALILSMRAADDAHHGDKRDSAASWYLENLRYHEGRRWRA